MTDRADTFWALCERLGVQPDRRGEVLIDCPHCGANNDGHLRFSFGPRGYHCFVCGQGGGIMDLWRIMTNEETPKPVRTRPAPPKRERMDPREGEAMARRYEAHPDAWDRWAAYAPSLPHSFFVAYRLGFGSLPQHMSHCTHPRLQVPLIAGGKVVGFRSRAVGCDCAKWLSPGGSRMILYNGQRLGETRARYREMVLIGDAPLFQRADVAGRHLYIVENPIDALLADNRGWPAVATLGVTIWRDEWTRLLYSATPRAITVAYDNDHAGCITDANRARIESAWRDSGHDQDMPEAGNKLAARLCAAKLPAQIFPWPDDAPLGCDLGDILRNA